MNNFAGVYESKKKDGTVYYRASITFQGRHVSLGSFSFPQDAEHAYWEATAILREKKYSIEDIHLQFLSFEKAIILLNFRDNGLYFSVPIYMYSNFFHYYLTPDYILTFDIDDLFYYSRHKIMRRGGHLFVSDFGMQENILNRYKIRNFAVAGRDYRFRNGDPTDFRYSNVEVINRYYGVLQIHKRGIVKYKVKIHVNGDYIVGTYSTEEKAAIAYNKAVDLLRSNGFTKNYPVNYLENISPRTYAEIYSKIKISEKLSSLVIHKGNA